MTDTPTTKRKPNPGSDAALRAGCICAVMDNHRGIRSPWGDGRWWVTVGCPVHHPEGAP